MLSHCRTCKHTSIMNIPLTTTPINGYLWSRTAWILKEDLCFLFMCWVDVWIFNVNVGAFYRSKLKHCGKLCVSYTFFTSSSTSSSVDGSLINSGPKWIVIAAEIAFTWSFLQYKDVKAHLASRGSFLSCGSFPAIPLEQQLQERTCSTTSLNDRVLPKSVVDCMV